MGMSLGTTAAHLGRAALDSVILQVSDVLDALAEVDAGIDTLLVDGGMTTNHDLMARQAVLADLQVRVSRTAELSALGAAHAAGLGAGLWSKADLDALPRDYDAVVPDAVVDSASLRESWRTALAASRASHEHRSAPEQCSVPDAAQS